MSAIPTLLNEVLKWISIALSDSSVIIQIAINFPFLKASLTCQVEH